MRWAKWHQSGGWSGHARARAGSDHLRVGLDQLIARGDNPLPAGRRSRFDNHKRVCGQLPELLQNRMPSFRRKLVQDVGHSDQIARFAVDGVNGNIRNAPGDVRQLSFRR